MGNAYDTTMVATASHFGAVWFFLFNVVVTLVLLNVLLAVIMDVYTEVKGSVGSRAETIWSQSVEIWDRYQIQRQGGFNLVALRDILQPTVDKGVPEFAEETYVNT